VEPVEESDFTGRGKTILLRSWINEAGLADQTAWVSARSDERDPQQFWLSVLRYLGVHRRTDAVARALGLLAPTAGRHQDDRTP
jgi:LuxR family maltose regulon positive regulatory protein